MEYHKRLSKNKSFEFQLGGPSKYGSLFGFKLNFATKIDHAGFEFQLELFRFFLDINIYDHRHWNEEENRWCEYGPNGEAV